MVIIKKNSGCPNVQAVCQTIQQKLFEYMEF
jgi:hypothetical protein